MNSSSGQFIISGLFFGGIFFIDFLIISENSGSIKTALASPCFKINSIDFLSNLVLIVFKTAPAMSIAK